MSYKAELVAFAKNIRTLQKYLRSRDTVRQSLVVPFFKILGWDVYNPGEFMAGFPVESPHGRTLVADFAVLRNETPVILVQTYFGTEEPAEEQAMLAALFRLVPGDKVAVLTNGVDWKFFADGAEPGVMDPAPYLVLNLGEKTRAEDLAPLDAYHKEVFDLAAILAPLRLTIYEKKIADYFVAQRTAATADRELIDFIIRRIYEGEPSSPAREKLAAWIVNAFAVIPPKNGASPAAAPATAATPATEPLEELEIVRPVNTAAPAAEAGSLPIEGRLTVIAGEDKGKSAAIRSAEFIVGRNLDLDLVLADPSVSRRHFRIFFENGAFWAEDLGSGNKIKVNGVKTTQRKQLAHNDVIQAGNTTLRFETTR